MIALSELQHATSDEFNLLMSRTQNFFADHYLVCAVLDPRVKRKVRNLFLSVADRGFRHTLGRYLSNEERHSLIDEYLHYCHRLMMKLPGVSWQWVIQFIFGKNTIQVLPWLQI